MISFTRVETKEIDEKALFEDLKEYLFSTDAFNNNTYDYIGSIADLPKDVQRLVFAKVGAIMIDYAGSEEF